MTATSPRPNFLLYGFIFVSLVIHFFVFLHVAGIYESRTISYIELSMQQLSSPDVRKIPTPRIRQKTPKVSEVKTIQATKIQIPALQEKISDPRVDQNLARIDLPQLPERMNISGLSVPGLLLPGKVATTQDTSIEFASAKDYFEMLHLRIHRFKRYPDAAKSNHIEGRVKVQFVLSGDGTLSDVKILQSSRHRNLDEAAMDAIKKASPFPRPPGFIFKTPVTLQVDILFELV